MQLERIIVRMNNMHVYTCEPENKQIKQLNTTLCCKLNS